MPRDQWSIALLLREAVRNVLSRHSRLFPLLIVALLLSLAVVGLAVADTHQLRLALGADVAAGRNVLVISAVDPMLRPARIGRASCEGLADNSGIAAAGFLNRKGAEDSVQLGRKIPLIESSQTLFPLLAHHGAVVGSSLGPDRGSFWLNLPDGSTVSATVGPRRPDLLGTNASIVIGAPPSVTTIEACYVILDVRARSQVDLETALAHLNSTGGPLTAVRPAAETLSPIDTYLGRITEYFPLAVGVVLGFCAILVNRFRAGEWALYRMSGSSPRSVLLIIALEQIVLAGIFAAAAALALLALGSHLNSPLAILEMIVAGSAAWIVITGLAGIEFAVRVPTNLTKDR